MDEIAIRDKLVQYGIRHISEGRELVNFTDVPEADRLLNDLTDFPHAFVLACIMDRQIKAERAWIIPHEFQKRMNGSFTMEDLGKLSLEDVKKIMSSPTPLHRFTNTMSDNFYEGIQKIKTQYQNVASKIWTGNPTSTEVVGRFLEFRGVGPKIATMAANILVRYFRIELSEYSSIDISADIHIQRVFGRLGLCSFNPSTEEVIYKARILHPEFPGMLDISCWHIGRNWCKSSSPDCSSCFMNGLCPKIGI